MQMTKLKEHLPYIIAIVLLALVFFHRPFNLNELPADDRITFYFPRGELIKQSIARYNDFIPLWNPYIMSGTPFFAYPSTLGTDNLLGILVLVMPTVAALRLSYLLSIMLAGIFMYILMTNIKVDKRFAFIAALVFMFNGYALMMFRDGWLTSLNAYALMPLVLLFTIKAFKSKSWLIYSIITGIIFAIQLRGGPDLKVVLFTVLMFFLYFLFSLIGKNLLNGFVKAAIVSFIVFIVFFGLSAQKILPVKEYTDISSRGRTPWEQASSRKLAAEKMFNELIEPIYEGMPEIQRTGRARHVGIVSFLLIGFALYKKRKNKFVLFLLTAALLAILIATGSFVFYLLWKYLPGFGGFRYANRALILYVFSGSILAGIGANAIFSELDKRNFSKRKKNIAYFSIITAILLNLAVFGPSPIAADQANVNEAIKNNHVLQNLSKTDGIFRIETYETIGIDWGTEAYNIPLGLEHIYGYETAWYQPYINGYLNVALRNNNHAKFWGILNVEYLTARNEINLPGFKFIDKFEECNACWPETEDFKKAYGPYLYENELFLPRAYFSGNAVLVFGEDYDQITNFMIEIIGQDFFDPKHSAIIRGKDLKDLKRFDLVILGKSEIAQSDISSLKMYVEEGGILSPNIFEGEVNSDIGHIEKVFDSFKAEIKPIDDNSIITHSFERKEIKLNGSYKDGFLVLSEKYSLFPGWRATADGNEIEILNANSMNSAVYLDKAYNSIIFEYKPSSYRVGSIITIITILGLVVYFLFHILKKNRKTANVSE